MKAILTILYLAVTFVSSFGQFTNDELKIIMLQDKRIPGESNELFQYLKSNDNELKWRALLALSNLQDSNLIHELKNSLGTSLITPPDFDIIPNPDPYSLAYFVLGQTTSQQSINNLLEALKNRNNNHITDVLVNLGKIGDETAFREVLLFEPTDEFEADKLVEAIARFGMRRIRSAEGFKKLADVYEKYNNRISTAYAFARGGDKELLTPYRDVIRSIFYYDLPRPRLYIEHIDKAADEQEALFRMYSASALGKIANPDDLKELMQAYEYEKDWRVRVNILNSIPNYIIETPSILNDHLVSFLLNAAQDNSLYVSVTALQSLSKLPVKEFESVKNYFESYFNSRDLKQWQQKVEAINAYSIIFKDDSETELMQILRSETNFDLKAAALRGFQNFENPKIYEKARDEVSKIVQQYNITHPNTNGEIVYSEDLALLYRAFVDMLTGIDDKASAKDKNIIRLMLSEFSSSRDPYITVVTLGALADTLYKEYKDETIQVMLFDFKELDYPEDKDVIQMYMESLAIIGAQDAVPLLEEYVKMQDPEISKTAANALEQLTKKTYEHYTLKNNNMSLLNNIPSDFKSREVTATLITTKGNITFKFYPYEAPFTVANFIKLANENFYDSTRFHRVIPNFVIQGGDPSGTGYSGPRETQRSEFSSIPFTAGTVGMASSGKDTEGSQFFITHSPQPHLDGKYTVFGQVREGMDVVNRIYMGDMILDVIIK